MQKRRAFLRNSAALALGGLISPSMAGRISPPGVRSIGLQLYTVASMIDDDVDGTLKKIASIGYKEIESAASPKGGFYGLTTRDFKKAVQDAGLIWRSHHVTGAPSPSTTPGPIRKNLKENYREVVAEAAEAGIRYLVCSSTPTGTLDDLRNSIDVLNKTSELCKRAGVKLAYHNHEREFQEVEGEVPYHLLLTQTNAGDLDMELDLAWATTAGVDPLELFKKYPGRFPLWHVKDLSSDHSTLEPVGEGSINFYPIFAKAKEAGMKYFFVEHDKPADPIRSITTSFENLTKLFAAKP